MALCPTEALIPLSIDVNILQKSLRHVFVGCVPWYLVILCESIL